MRHGGGRAVVQWRGNSPGVMKMVSRSWKVLRAVHHEMALVEEGHVDHDDGSCWRQLQGGGGGEVLGRRLSLCFIQNVTGRY